MRRSISVVVVLIVHINLLAQNFNLRINEIVTSNQTGQLDEFLEYEDWVEIYNPPGNPVTNLGGYFISDDPDSLTKWMIPGNDPALTSLIPGGFLAIWIDDDFNNATSQGANHNAGFMLSSEGETFLLTAPDGVTVIDSITYPLMTSDISYGRTCDGCSSWQYFNNTTFESSNQEILNNHLVFINEVQVVNTSTYDDAQNEFDPWIELFNPNSFQVNVAGYTLSIDGNSLAWQVPSTNPIRTVIPAGGFILIWCDNDIIDGVDHAPLSLFNTGSITLNGPVGNANIDTYSYSNIPNNASYGRVNDGAISSMVFTNPTPTVSNQLVIIQPDVIVINELLPANQNGIVDEFGELEDWIELYNPGNSPINVGGYYLSDDPLVRNKWIIPTSNPDSTTIPAQGWLLFWADNDEAQGVRHAGFRLSNNGEYLSISGPDGYTLADEIEWGYIAPDTSLGRSFDASPEWILFPIPTPNASNGTAIAVNEIIADGLKVYPNPARDRIFLSNASYVAVFNLLGEKVFDDTSASQIDVSALPSGCYMLRVGKLGVYKILVE